MAEIIQLFNRKILENFIHDCSNNDANKYLPYNKLF